MWERKARPAGLHQPPSPLSGLCVANTFLQCASGLVLLLMAFFMSKVAIFFMSMFGGY